MRTVILRGFRARSRRFIGTFFAIFLGVAFLSGTLVLNDTLQANFDQLFTDVNAGTDVVVRNATDIGTDDNIGGGLIPAGLADTVRAVDGVAAAEPEIQGYGQIVGADGELIGGNGPPTFATNWIDDPALNPYELAEGRAPEVDDEVVINRGAAKDGGIALGDTIQVRVPQPVEVRVVGIVTFGGGDGLGPTTYTAFTMDAAQQYLAGGTDQVNSLRVEATDGVGQDELAGRIQDVLPANTEAVTGADVTSEDIDDINSEFLGFLQTFLLVFSCIALLVATFTIHNTFAIVIAQRTRESALLRALGAARAQVLGSVLVESLVLGVVASIAGLVGGIGIATLLKAMFKAFGFDALPTGGLQIEPAGLLVAFGVGVVVAVVAGLTPAVKAGRVAPLAALREVAVEQTRVGRVRTAVGLAIALGGIALVVVGTTGTGGLATVGIGAIVTVVGMVAAGPLVARPVTAVLGAPLAAGRGITGALARQNAMRSPRRTAGTAAALMIGVGVVTLFTVFAASIKASIDDVVSASLTGDVVVSAGAFGGSGFSPELATGVAASPDVAAAAGLGRGAAQLAGDTTTLTIVDPGALAAVTDLTVSGRPLADLGPAELAVAAGVADDNGWAVGTPVPVTFADGTTATFTVATTYERTAIVGNTLMSREAWTPHAIQDIDTAVLIDLAPGVSESAGLQTVTAIAAGFGGPDVLTRDEYVADMTGGIDMALSLIYVMLALAIVIAVMGIANTLSLSVHERTRELGLLRAVGQDRAGTRAMVRWESVIISVFGTAGGLGLGIFLGWGVMRGVASADSTPLDTFALPVSSLAIILVVGAVAGVLAGTRPARRAARTNIVAAIASS